MLNVWVKSIFDQVLADLKMATVELNGHIHGGGILWVVHGVFKLRWQLVNRNTSMMSMIVYLRSLLYETFYHL